LGLWAQAEVECWVWSAGVGVWVQRLAKESHGKPRKEEGSVQAESAVGEGEVNLGTMVAVSERQAAAGGHGCYERMQP
jgi:hypothetical protein